MARVRWARVADAVLFSVCLFAAHLIALHGKALSSRLLGDASGPVIRDATHKVSIYLVYLASTGLFLALRFSVKTLRIRLLLCLATIIGAAVIAESLAISHSAIIFFLQIYILTVAAAIVIIEEQLTLKMDKEFWKILLDALFRFVRFAIVFWGAGVVILRFLVDRQGESNVGFLSTLAYPTFILVFSIAMIGYWIGLPCWEHLVASHKVSVQHEPASDRSTEASGRAHR